MLELAMKIISLDAPNVWMDSRPADSGPSFELPLDLPPEIDQRDIEDLFNGFFEKESSSEVVRKEIGRAHV